MVTHNRNNNLITNGDFQVGRIGALPEGWRETIVEKSRAPVFALAQSRGRKVLRIQGNGADDCYGYLAAPVTLKAGRTYVFRVRFRMSSDVNPQWNLRFSVYSNQREDEWNNGIFRFRRCKDGRVEGENRFQNTTGKILDGQVRIYYAFNASGKVYVEDISLAECDPVPARPVKVAATEGSVSLDEWSRVLDAAGREKVDLVLLPETFRLNVHESRRGPAPTLLSKKARQWGMYTAGGFYLREGKRIYNTCMLFDRKGKLVGRYDKIHPYTPEFRRMGVTPGRDAPVFKTDFGKVGILICYDSWFTDVAELLALKGAEIVLFPNAGYFRGLMPARASDNGVRFVVSSLGVGMGKGKKMGIWDTVGRDVTDPDADPTDASFVPLKATVRGVHQRKVGKAKLLIATLDLSQSPSPANWGGPCLSSPGGRKNRREQLRLLYDEIRREQERWWEE